MKLILGVLLLIISTFIGYIFSEKYKKRKNYYQNFRLFNSRLKNELIFTKKSILELIDLKEFDDFIINLNNYFNNVNIEELSLPYLNNEEINFFYDYAKRIGSGDKDSQLQYVNEIDVEISKRFIDAEEKEKKYKALYVKIGFLIGLILLIIVL